MIGMAEKKPKGSAEPKKRNTIQFTVDDATEVRLQRFLEKQRIKPDRAAVGLTALIEFLDREEKKS